MAQTEKWTPIIGLVGAHRIGDKTYAMRAGKDLFIGHLHTLAWNLRTGCHSVTTTRIAFADQCVEEICRALKITRAFYESNKPAFRGLMQQWGTEVRRKLFGEDYWIKRWYHSAENFLKYTPNGLIIAPDVRFPNELQIIKDLGGMIIRIYRESDSLPHGVTEMTHESEAHAVNMVFDLELQNTGTVEDFAANIQHFWFNYGHRFAYQFSDTLSRWEKVSRTLFADSPSIKGRE